MTVVRPGLYCVVLAMSSETSTHHCTCYLTQARRHHNQHVPKPTRLPSAKQPFLTALAEEGLQDLCVCPCRLHNLLTPGHSPLPSPDWSHFIFFQPAYVTVLSCELLRRTSYSNSRLYPAKTFGFPLELNGCIQLQIIILERAKAFFTLT